MELDIEMQKELVRKCLDMRKMSYTPYSHWNVGAALLTDDDQIVTGCNVENAGYTATNCAERTAFFKAVSEGKRKFKAIAISGGPAGQDPVSYCGPCGVCRQVMREFCSDDFLIYVAKSEDDYLTYTLGELLPLSFGPEDLGKA